MKTKNLNSVYKHDLLIFKNDIDILYFNIIVYLATFVK